MASRVKILKGKYPRGHTFKYIDGAFRLYQNGEFIARFKNPSNMKHAQAARTHKDAKGRIRPCMCCNDNFYSDHIGVRLCAPCKAGKSED